MTTIWQKHYHQQHYEVRTAGNSVRLYKDGVLHSQFNERQPITGQVWDLLLLPTFFYPQQQIKRILVLGVGGGTVIRQLNLFFKPEKIIGIDLDPIHLNIAKRFFGLNKQKNVSLHCDDAKAWLNEYTGPPFDIIIEDIFSEENGQPVRAIDANSSWAKSILRHLSLHGAVISNFTSAQEAKQSAFIHNVKIRSRFQSHYLLGCYRNENIVGAFLKHASSHKMLKQNLRRFPALDTRRKTCRLDYRLLNLAPQQAN